MSFICSCNNSTNYQAVFLRIKRILLKHQVAILIASYILECSIPSCNQCVTFVEFCSVKCNGTKHSICQQCERNSQLITDEVTSNCNLDDSNKDCISAFDQTTIQHEPAEYGSGDHKIKTLITDGNNLQTSLPSDSTFDSTSGSTDIQESDSNQLQTTMFDNINTAKRTKIPSLN